MYDTLISMGKETADVYRYENLTENQKKKLMIADNKIFNLGIENLDTFNSFLEELQGDLDIPGFDEDILKQMVSDAEDVTEKLSEYGTLDDEEIKNFKKREQSQSTLEPNTDESGFNEEKNIENKPIITTNEDNAEYEETTEIKKFIICPKCGEKIWL